MSDPAQRDAPFLQRAVALALAAERAGNLPIAAIVVLGHDVVAEAANAVYRPAFRPGRHAEMLALERMPAALCLRAAQLTLYCTLEPCVMCFGAIVAHRLGRVVFGSRDPLSGATDLPKGLPEYVAAKARAIAWVGPALPEVCDPLRDRAILQARALRAALPSPAAGA